MTADVDDAAQSTSHWLIFRVEDAYLALETQWVNEICAHKRHVPIPHAPTHIPGLISLHGHAVPLLDLSVFLSLRRASANTSPERHIHRIAIVEYEGIRVGILCDDVVGVAEFTRTNLRAVDGDARHTLFNFALAEMDYDDACVTALDIKKIFSQARVAA